MCTLHDQSLRNITSYWIVHRTKVQKLKKNTPPIPAALAGCIAIKEKGWEKTSVVISCDYSRDWHRDRESLWAETRLDGMVKKEKERKLISKLFYNHFRSFFASFFLSLFCLFLLHQDSFPLSVLQLTSQSACYQQHANFLMSTSFKVNMKRHLQHLLLLLPKCATQKYITGHSIKKTK